jgi:hypothetical protein
MRGGIRGREGAMGLGRGMLGAGSSGSGRGGGFGGSGIGPLSLVEGAKKLFQDVSPNVFPPSHMILTCA